MLAVNPHLLLDLRAFITEFPGPLGSLAASPTLLELLRLEAPAPLRSSNEVRRAVRDLLRSGGFRPTGRSRNLRSEYLIWRRSSLSNRAAETERWYHALLETQHASTRSISRSTAPV